MGPSGENRATGEWVDRSASRRGAGRLGSRKWTVPASALGVADGMSPQARPPHDTGRAPWPWLRSPRSAYARRTMTDHRRGPTTERLVLRKMEPEDAEAFFRIQSDPEVMRFTHEEPPASVEEVRAALAAYPDFDEVGYGRWGCYLKGSGELIGFSGLKVVPEFETTDLGYRFLPRYWGQGFATESGFASLSYGFDVIGLERIDAFVLPENTASIRVLEKLGMECDGTVVFDGLEAQRFAARRGSWTEPPSI